MERKLVSVIIPSFNSEEYIAETLDSVIAQTWKDLEIIVVDDGSNDETVQVVRRYERAGIVCLSQPNKGACTARNLGFLHSSGDYIQFLDADDILAPDKIEKQLMQLLSYPDSMHMLIHCKWGRFTTYKEEVYYWGPDNSIQRELKPIDWLVENKWSITGSWLLHRNLIEESGLWNESLKRNQDGEFYARVMLHANAVLYSDEAKVYYRSGNKNSITNTKTRPAIESLLRSLHLIEKYMLQLEVSSRVKLSIANRYQDFVYSNYIENPDLASFAEYKVKELGGSELKLPGGNTLRCLSRMFGWKTALKLKKLIYKGGGERLL